MNTKNKPKLSPEDFKALLISRVEGIGPVVFKKLIRKFKSAEDLLRCSRKKLRKLVSEKLASNISNVDLDENSKYLTLLKENNISFISVLNKDYPKLLKQIHDPPIILYYVGDFDINLFKNCFAVVGTRRMSSYGKKVTEEICERLVDAGFTVVSGMAFGIDKKAHESSLGAGGNTIAVIPGRVDRPTPRSNFKIYKKIRENNVILSGSHLDVRVSSGMFPRRNRIISGLSVGTLVVEAGVKSGALITARIGLEQGREIFAIPSDIYSRNSIGTNELIKNGEAKLVQGVDDILEEFGFKVEKQRQVRKYSAKEQKIVEVLINSPCSVDRIASLTDMDISELLQILSVMEIDGLLAKNAEGMYFILK